MFFRSIIELYSFHLPAVLIVQFRRARYSGWRLFDWFWHAKAFRPDRELTEVERSVSLFLGLFMLAQVALGVGFLVEWYRYGTAGAWEFGLALLLSYPLVWAHVLVVLAWVWSLVWGMVRPKQAARALVCTALEWQVTRLRRRRHFKVVAVAGSVGKTGTKLAIAELLSQTMRVRYQTGNYNDRVTVPLVFFGLEEPSLYNVFAWLNVFGAMNSEVAFPFPYDVVVVELGTDTPGSIAQFEYIKPDITVVTAVSEEHMENFGTLDKVATEELEVFGYSDRVLVNGDDIPGKYLAGREFTEYSLRSPQADYYGSVKANGLKGQKLGMSSPKGAVSADICYLGEQGAKTALAAAAVASILGVKKTNIAKGLAVLHPFSGRMQVLEGIKNTTLLDDTYNASPLAVKAALNTLYDVRAGRRIAILGDMNELGDLSRKAHEEAGAYCNPNKLDVVVTVGKDAKKWLAPAAREQGCTVQSFDNPHDAGAYVSGKLRRGAVVLAKGSQNGVFTEEALKPLLADPTDAEKLVRQSSYWLAKKRKQFGA